MKRLTWIEASAKLKPGVRVVFVEPWDIYPITVVPAGMTATVVENGLNEIWCALEVRPDDEAICDALREWEGNVHLGTHLSPGADIDGDSDEAEGWRRASPLALANDQPPTTAR